MAGEARKYPLKRSQLKVFMVYQGGGRGERGGGRKREDKRCEGRKGKGRRGRGREVEEE